MPMQPANIPAACTSCGAVFPSRGFKFSGNISGLTLERNAEPCPFCGGRAWLAEGIFDIADSVVSVVRAPTVTFAMLEALGLIVQQAYENHTPAQELEKQAAAIHPDFAKPIRKVGKSKLLYATTLLLLLAAIKSCNVSVALDIKLDANQLIEQIRGVPASEITSQEPRKK